MRQNSKEEKEMLPFVTQYQPLSVYYKRKSGILIQNHTLLCQIFSKKNHLSFSTRKENHGKEPAEEPPREQTFLSCMAFSVLACEATRTTS